MEEEAQRIAQGQVPEPVPESVLCKDSTPSSINAIFSPPVGQFEYTSPPIPTYNPFETPSPLPDPVAVMFAEKAATLAAYEQFGGEEPMEASEAPTMPAHHEEAATGVPPFDPCSSPTPPTAEEVDAALAVLEELDNIPDGVCESGEVEEEEEEEEEWSYFRMDPQTHPQGEDVLVEGSAGAGGDTDLVKEVATSPVDHTPQNLLSQPGQSELLVQQEVHQEVHTTQLNEESFREDFYAKEDQDISGEAKLLDFEYQPLKGEMDPFHHDINVPMEAAQPPVMDHSPNIFQASMENVPELEISSGKMLNLELSSDGVPDFLDKPAEPYSPVLPGSPRSVEGGYITSVELNTPEESMGTNFNINQTQDLNSSGMDQPSGSFSVYVSSSPEPLSLEPSLLPPVDLGVSEVSNGQAEEEGNRPQSGDSSNVEIVHAQSTVEVLAPPSPGEKQEAEMEFVIPDHVPDLMTTSQIIMEEPSDITFILEPAIKPVAEVPVPVYLEGTTPVSDGEREEPSSESLSTKEDAAEPEKDLVSLDTKMATSPPPPAASEPKIVEEDRQETRAPFQEEMEIVPPVNNGMVDWQETAAPIQEETVPSIVNEVIDRQEVQAPVQEESVPLVNSEVVKNKVVDVILTPEVTPVDPEKKIEVPKAKLEVAKSPTKVARTPAKSSPDKAGKTTPAQDTTRKTPVSKTFTRTPLTKSAEKRTPLSKTDAKPSPTKTPADKAGAARSTTAKPTSTTRLTTTKPAAPKPMAARPMPRTTKAPTPTQPSTKPTEKKVPKPSTPTVPRAALSKPSSTTAKSATTRPMPATRLTTKRPGTAPPARPTDKADSIKLNGTARSSTRPATTPRTTGASTMTTTARKPLSTRPTTKSTAEKETKNTTNRILSTATKPAPRSTLGAARTATTKTSTLGRTTEAKTTSRLNGTAATTTTATTKTRMTRSTATKATDVATKKAVGSRLKAAPGTKTSPAKAAPVIEVGPTVVNGENKISHEETSVEVVEKCAAEDTVQVTEKILTEAMTTQQVIITETTEVIVNGDH